MHPPVPSFWIFSTGIEPVPQPPTTICLLLKTQFLLIISYRQLRVGLFLIPLLLQQELSPSLLHCHIVQLLFVLLHLVLDIIAHLQFLFQVSQDPPSVQEEHESVFQCFFVVGSGGNMNAALGKDGILSIHQFVEQHSQRVGIVLGVSGDGRLFELFMAEIGDISFFDESLSYFLI